ncbi:MAG: hypothetical protein KQI81_22180 [Deltaproteobacteria bacterium]|nr:hypothetical protein [Deltaproteobacteria bacterium]
MMDIQWLLPMPHQMTESGKSLPASMALRAGDLLTASVLGVEKDNDALLSIGQFKAYARLPLPVVTGQDIQIRVEAAGENLRMVMVPKSDPAANVPTGDRLEIRLFEPISDRPLLSDPSRSLVPGESLQGRITGFEKNGLMLVDFGKFKAFAKIDIPVRQGQTIPLTVVKSDNGIALAMGPKVQTMEPNSLPTPTEVSVTPKGQTGATQQASVASPALHAQPEIISNLSDKAATVGPAPPPTAAEIAVLREQIQQILDGTLHPVKAATMPLSTPMKGALINLQQALNPASPTGDMPALVARVRDFIQNSGLYFEKRLEQAIHSLQALSTSMTPDELARQPVIRDLMVNDLKPNLLILKEFLDRQPIDSQGGDRHLLETLKSVVQRTVSHIEHQQFMATEKPVDPDLFQAFSHLMFLTDTQRNARLKVYYAKKGREDAQKNPRVSLLLDMDRMGTVRTDLWMVGKDLNITFFVREAKVKAAIDTEHHRIGEMLRDTFNTVAVSVVVNEKKIAEFDGEDLTLPTRRQVDLSI